MNGKHNNAFKAARVTKFGEISPLWHTLKTFGHFEWKGSFWDAIGQIFIAVNGQKLNYLVTLHQAYLDW